MISFAKTNSRTRITGNPTVLRVIKGAIELTGQKVYGVYTRRDNNTNFIEV